MKTVEEKRASLLAECETLCPNEGDKINLLGDAALLSNCGDGIWKLDWKYMDGKIWLCAETSDWLVEVVYRLLGLSERDAVAAEKARSFKEIDSCTLSLGKMAIRAKVAEAKNAALVAALGKAKDYIKASLPNTIITGCKEENYYFAYQQLSEALAANEKGGKND